MLEMEKSLQERGWYLSSDGIERCKEGLSQPSVENIISAALDVDMREIGSPALQELIIRGKDDFLNGPFVLQIQKIRNVSAPKANEKSQHAPQLLRLYMTDGCGSISIVQEGNWSALKLFDKPPGTKLLIKKGSHSIKGPLLPLQAHEFTILGGKVDSLVEKWKIKMSMSNRIRSACGEVGPPPWVPFGHKIDYSFQKGDKTSFKSLETGDKENVKETQAFDEQRKATIAEISKSKEGVKKVFGKGKAEVNEYPDARRRDNRTNGETRPQNTFERKPKRENYRRDRSEREEESGSTAPSKPSTIFDFLETKLIDVVPSISQNSAKEATTKPHHVDNDYQEFESSYNPERDYNRNRGGGGRFRNDGNGSNDDRPRNRNSDSGSFQKGNRRDDRYGDRNNSSYKRNDYEDRRPNRGNDREQRPKRYDQPYQSDRTAPPKQNSDFSPLHNPSNFPELGSEAPVAKEREAHRTKNFTQSNQQHGASFAGAQRKNFKVGDQVMARYWEDRKFYNATIFATSEGSTCVVQFTEYGNYEEVLVDDVFYAGSSNNNQRESSRFNQPDGFNVPSTQPRQFQQSFNPKNAYGGDESSDANRRYSGYREKRGNQWEGHQATSGDAGERRNRGHKPNMQYYQPPRQRPQ